MGNAAVTRMLQRARHEHSAGCGPAPESRHSTTREVLDTPGTPLGEPVRREMETRLGADFSDVRLHAGTAAQRSGSVSDVQRAPRAVSVSVPPAGPRHEAVAIQRMGNCFSGSKEEAGIEPPRTRSSVPVVESLAPQVGNVLREVGLPLRELEIRMFDPEGVVMSIAFDPELGERPLAEGYQWLAQHFTSICGETVNLLQEITAPADARQRRSRTLDETIDELRRPEDANLSIRSHGHAFFVEKRRGTCRILQSYIGRYALTDSLAGAPVAGATRIPATEFIQRLQVIGEHHRENRRQGLPFQTDPDEERLFGGALFNESDIQDDSINLQCDSTTDVQSAQDQRSCVDARLERFATAWDQISTYQGTPAQWLDPDARV
jgi:hypothetical protein